MADQFIEYSLLYDIPSAEDFLREQFHCSSAKLKKFFDKNFLNRAFKSRSTLRLPLNFVMDLEINPVYSGDPIEIIAENENFLVLNKNPNQHVHPLSYDESDNCLSFIREKRPELLKVNKKKYDRGLLYRLDYETSGVLIYVKKEDLYKKLRDEFSSIARKKIYRCWVKGNCRLTGSYTQSFSSAGAKGKQVVVRELNPDDNSGTLSLRPLRFDQEKDATLMEVDLLSGLRHQIRAQLAYLGHPLLGDTFYGGPTASRLFLHAWTYQLSFDQKDFVFSKINKDFE